MALTIDKPAPSSATKLISYWRIVGQSVNYDSGITTVQVYGYWTAEDRAARMGAASIKEVIIIVPQGTEPTRAWLYGQVKLHAEFAGAEDA